jgi:hypothetical protein
MSTWTWDLGLRWWLDYFNMVDNTSTWDPGSLVYFNIMVHTYPWDPGIWLYFLLTSVDALQGKRPSSREFLLLGVSLRPYKNIQKSIYSG